MKNNMIFKRKIYSQLLDWKNSPIQNSALLIEGARRIGKSTIVEEFAKNEFNDNYLIVDFRKENDDVKKLFNNIKNLDEFFRQFFLSQNKVLRDGGLIIFDEVQFCPKAREDIKDFVKDGRYRFIETGSLISIKENTRNIMIPSEERRIEMYPMDFEEFLWASEGNEVFPLLKNEIDEHHHLSDSLHLQYMEKFRTYLIIGGMPKVVSIFLSTNSFMLAENEKLDILKLYSDDLRKHDKNNNTICNVLFDAIPSQLAKENKRFNISSTNKKRFAQIKQSLCDLCDYKIINIVREVSSLEDPLELNVVEDKFKLFFCDTGLLMSRLVKLSKEKMNELYFKFIKGKKTSLNLGAVYESIAVQQLVINNGPLFYHKYSMNNKNNELDIVFEKDFKVNIIEVKSSRNYTTSSLDKLKLKYPQLKLNKYVFGIKNVQFNSDKTTLPIYTILFI